MWNRNKKYRDWLRAQLGFKYQESMFPDEEEYPELNEEKVLEAIHVISVASKLPENRIKEAVIKLINEQQILFMESVNSVAQAVSNLTDATVLAAESLSKYADSILKEKDYKSIGTDLGSGKTFDESYTDMYDSFCGLVYSETTGVEFFRQQIVDEQSHVIRGYYRRQERYESQHEIANRNRHTSRHVPFYFSIVGQNRHVPRKNGKKYHTKFNRNVRPKGTHSHFKLYK